MDATKIIGDQLAAVQEAANDLAEEAGPPTPPATAAFIAAFDRYLAILEGEETPATRESLRQTLGEVLELFAGQEGLKAKNGKDFVVEIVHRPGTVPGILVRDRTPRGKDLIAEWREWNRRMEWEQKLATVWQAIGQIGQAVEGLGVKLMALEAKQAGKDAATATIVSPTGKVLVE